MTELAVGVDIGGTSSRALAVASSGAVVGRGSAAGGNPTTHPPDVAASRVASAVADALPDGASVAACLLGVAGRQKPARAAAAGKRRASQRAPLTGGDLLRAWRRVSWVVLADKKRSHHPHPERPGHRRRLTAEGVECFQDGGSGMPGEMLGRLGDVIAAPGRDRNEAGAVT